MFFVREQTLPGRRETPELAAASLQAAGQCSTTVTWNGRASSSLRAKPIPQGRNREVATEAPKFASPWSRIVKWFGFVFKLKEYMCRENYFSAYC